MLQRYQLSDFVITTKPNYFVSAYDKLYKIEFNREDKHFRVYVRRRSSADTEPEWCSSFSSDNRDRVLGYIMQRDLKKIDETEAFLMAL